MNVSFKTKEEKRKKREVQHECFSTNASARMPIRAIRAIRAKNVNNEKG